MDIFASARSLLRRLPLLPALLLWFASAAMAQAQEDPPGRVANLSYMKGSVVFAPDGEDEWMELPLNRPLTRGDRVWTDRGGRAELHMGSATVHMDSESHLAFFELNDQAAQLSLTQGSLSVRVRELAAGENFEIDTPNLAIRASQPGDYRIDVDQANGTTRVLVRSGEATVYGERGESLRLAAGQQGTFDGRGLAQVRGRQLAADEFDRWAMERNRAEDQSISARYVPRQVVGYQQLDAYGTWTQEASYGAVWYPHVTVVNWAPYRYGRWTYIRPWGWTWVDEAPWGFAPFHYGRWALIGSRWAWVPGHLGPRPVYAPALVGFVGGSGVNVSISIGSGPGIGWYPLAPGEAWRPSYRYSDRYYAGLNRNVIVHHHHYHRHVHRGHPNAWTALRMDDFHRGRPVRDHWKPVRPHDLAQAPAMISLPRPERERERWERPARLQAPPPAVVAHPVWPGRQHPGASAFGRGRAEEVHERNDDRRQAREQERLQQEQQRSNFVRQHEERAREMQRQQREAARPQQADLVREQERAQREQLLLQRDALRRRYEQVQEQERGQQGAVPPQREHPVPLAPFVRPQPPAAAVAPAAQPQQPAAGEMRGWPRGRQQEAEAGRGPRRERGVDAGDRRSQEGEERQRGRGHGFGRAG